MVLSWTAPANAATIEEYQVRRRISDSGQDWSSWSSVAGGSTVRDSTITGLTNGVTYQFEVQAVDSMDAPVAVSHTVSATPAGLPDAPSFRASPWDGQVVLRWDAANANGSVIARYEVQWRVANAEHGLAGLVPRGGRPLSARYYGYGADSMAPSTSLRCGAVNGVGAGASATQSATPQAVVLLPLTASRGDGQVVLSWTAPANAATIEEYQVRRRISDSGQDWSSWSTVAGGSTARDTTITGLTNGVTYQFEAQAVDSMDAPVAVSHTVSATPKRPSMASFGSILYEATEGGAGVSITVRLSPVLSQAVHIPVVVSAAADTEADDYTVLHLTDGTLTLSFAAGAASRSFTITANEDADSADEMVRLTFGSLPADVVAVGTTRQAMVRLRDDDADLIPLFPSSGTSQAAIVGQEFNFTRPDATGGNPPLTYAVSSTCPDALAATDSAVSGTPSTVGQCGMTWTVRDADGDPDTYALQISVAADTEPALAAIDDQTFTVGTPKIVALPSAAGGNPPYTYALSVAAGSRPAWLLLEEPSAGVWQLRGSATAPALAQTYTWTATDHDGDAIQQSFQLEAVRPAPGPVQEFRVGYTTRPGGALTPGVIWDPPANATAALVTGYQPEFQRADIENDSWTAFNILQLGSSLLGTTRASLLHNTPYRIRVRAVSTTTGLNGPYATKDPPNASNWHRRPPPESRCRLNHPQLSPGLLGSTVFHHRPGRLYGRVEDE